MRTHKTFFVIVRGADRSCRITSRWPARLRADELAYRLTVVWPEGWGRIATETLTLTLPDPPLEIEVSDDAIEPYDPDLERQTSPAPTGATTESEQT